jgi:predicted acylesterase/phospholipase RssA
VLVAPAASDKCYALVISGGGMEAPFEIGALRGIYNRSPQEAKWNVVVGTSSGSMLTAVAAIHKLGDESNMIERMSQLTNSMGANTIYKRDSMFDYGKLLACKSGLSWLQWTCKSLPPGLVDSKPLLETLKQHLGEWSVELPHDLIRNISIGATNDHTGAFDRFNETMFVGKHGEVDINSLATFAMASSALPGFFPSVEINENFYSDGGILVDLDVSEAVRRCREVTKGNDSDIVVDIVSVHAKFLHDWEPGQDNNPSAVMSRANGLEEFYSNYANLAYACAAHPKVTWRYYIEPACYLPVKTIKQFGHDVPTRSFGQPVPSPLPQGLNKFSCLKTVAMNITGLLTQDVVEEMRALGENAAMHAKPNDMCKKLKRVTDALTGASIENERTSEA